MKAASLLRRTRYWSLFAIILCSMSGAHASLFGHVVERAAGHVAKQVLPQPEAAVPVDLPRAGSFEPCRDSFPRGRPVQLDHLSQAWQVTPLCSNTFAVAFSGVTKTPLLVVERLNKQRLADALDEARTNEFFSDPRLPPGSRSDLADYRGSGFDRGHMAPAANQPDQVAMVQSFVLSNTVPQDPHHNQKVWSQVESSVRKFARRAHGNVFVFTGPIFARSSSGYADQRTIGRNRVWVPARLFKLVYDEASSRAWAYIQDNSPDAVMGPPVDYQTFVGATGWDVLAGLPVSNR